MADLKLTIPADDLPAPGEVTETQQQGYVILVENVQPLSDADEDSATAQPGELVKYVPVDITAPSSVVRHAARVFQRNKRTRVERWTLCDRSGGRVVSRRRDAEPLTNVTCAQCRGSLVGEGLLSE
jgi:hypothetical protein